LYPTTAVVADHHDRLDLQNLHGELQYRQAVEIGMKHEIGHISMDKHLARQEADDLVRGNPTVGAADPEILRRLLLSQAREELRVLRQHTYRPCPVVGEERSETVHRGSFRRSP
jgi:hypothetical protein